MESIETILSNISSVVWGWGMIILLMGTHIFLTIRLRFPQRHLLTAIRLSLSKDRNASGDVSQFAALATSLAATVGTGNIIGVATAISLGGPGAVFWCWITGVLGIATKYGEGLLAIKYRVRSTDGRMLGGPMFALERGLGAKWLGIIFASLAAIAAFGIGNMVQANSISTLIAENYSLSPHIIALVLVALVALVIIFGVKGIANTCTAFVPIMLLLYLLGSIYILCINSGYLLDAVMLILRSAFSTEAAVGGAIGGSLQMAMRYGISRGLFSNESGLGSAPIVAAAAQTRNPVRQALVSSTATFWDTVVICAITGLVLVSSILAFPEIDYTQGAMLTNMAFSKIPYVGTTILILGISTFAFSTILGWTYYSERCVEYLGGQRAIPLYRIAWLVAIYIGATMQLDIVWSFSDITNALMAIPNIISLILLSGVIVSETRRYLWSGRLDERSPEPPTIRRK